MEKRGFEVTKIDLDDLTSIKEKYRIPARVQDCHTSVIGDYYIEGHVPAAAVERLLREKPKIAGLALPGMPSGSPGMPGIKHGPFRVLQVNFDGSLEVFGEY